jgi:hypothetical protein
MGRTACTVPQCLYKGTLYLYLYVKTDHLMMFFHYNTTRRILSRYNPILKVSKFHYRSITSCMLSHPSRFQTTVFTALHYSSLLRVLHALLFHWRLFISDLLHSLLNMRTHLRLYSHNISISSKIMYVHFK